MIVVKADYCPWCQKGRGVFFLENFCKLVNNFFKNAKKKEYFWGVFDHQNFPILYKKNCPDST
jgi:hypothetical protein